MGTSIRHDMGSSVLVEWKGYDITMSTDLNVYDCSRSGFDLIPAQEYTDNKPDAKSLWWKCIKLANSDIVVTFFCNEPPANLITPDDNIEAIQENNDYD